MNTWIVVCDGSRARFFMTNGVEGDWVKFEELEHPAGRAKGIDLITDRPGRKQPGRKRSDGSPQQRGSLKWADPRTVEELRFAHSIAQTLESARALDAYERLIIVSPPAFLGMLREELSPRVAQSIFATLDRDYSRLEERELQERVVIPATPGM